MINGVKYKAWGSVYVFVNGGVLILWIKDITFYPDDGKSGSKSV